MIAWAGMERLKALEAGKYEPWVQEWMKGVGMARNSVGLRPHLPMERGLTRSVEDARIEVKRVFTKDYRHRSKL
jgi:hypothetical protein